MNVHLLSILIFTTANTSNAQTSQVYQWKNVAIKGGGLVSGIIYSRAEANLLYARTDVGGAYRWNSSTKTWTPLTDFMTMPNNWGIVSLAADPVNSNNVYLATGLYTQSWWGQNGAIYGSTDKGDTWTLLANLSFKLGGNSPGRASGERLQIDPNLNTTLYLGSNENGLWKSTNSGVTWSKVTSFPANKITCIFIDKTSGSAGSATPVIYAGVCDHLPNTNTQSIYRSTDAGLTWSFLAGQPTSLTPKTFAPGNTALTPIPNHMVKGGNYLYISYANSVLPNGDYQMAAPASNISNGAVYRYNTSTNVWTELTAGFNSNQGGFGGITIHPTNPNIVIASTAERWWPQDELHISTDAGANWNTVLFANTYSSTSKASIDYSKAPYSQGHNPHWIGTLEMNPFNPDEIMFVTGFGIFASYNFSQAFTNNVTSWVYENDGLEETVPLEIVSPPSGAPLLSAIGDYDGFRHNSLTVSPPAGEHSANGGTNPSIAFAENNPLLVVRTHSNAIPNRASYSSDGGTTWSVVSGSPAGVTGGGQIAISSNGTNIVWSPEGTGVYYSTTAGSGWTASSGIPAGTKPVADRVNNSKFYGLNQTSGSIYYSANGGNSFVTYNAVLPAFSNHIAAVFGQEGHIWAATNTNGLYYSTNGGSSFTKVTSVQASSNVAFGMAAPSGSYPAVFIAGTVGGQTGLFRSDNMGSTWVKINDSSHEFARTFRTMTGDPRVYGRLYIGTEGRGILYGDIDASLPFSLLNFYANRTGEEIELQWNVEDDRSVLSYEIFKSTDLISWNKIRELSAHHTSTALYEISDWQQDACWYQLRMNMNDGKQTIFTRFVESDRVQTRCWVSGFSRFRLHATFDILTVNVFSAEGRNVLSPDPDEEFGEELPAGVYLIRVEGKNGYAVVKLMKR